MALLAARRQFRADKRPDRRLGVDEASQAEGIRVQSPAFSAAIAAMAAQSFSLQPFLTPSS